MQLLRLQPGPAENMPLQGLYLQTPLAELATPQRPVIYGNFVQSMDGRIAVETDDGNSVVPRTLTSGRDWRLFQELQAHADCLITHGGYLRALQAGQHGNILQIGHDPQAADLLDWRRQHGLHKQPAVVIASASLSFEIPESLRASGQEILIATGAGADPQGIRHWEQQGYKVMRCGTGCYVEGAALADALAAHGFRAIYLIAGPRMLHTMITGNRLSRLYLTISHQLLGGEATHTLMRGPQLPAPALLELRSLYYGAAQDGHASEWFAMFEST